MSHVFHRNPQNAYPVAVRGEGAYLVDSEGRRYLDASGGAAVSCLGHTDRAVVEAIKAQLDRLPFAHTSFFTNEPMEALADELIRRSPKAFERVYFVSGGSEAVEAALDTYGRNLGIAFQLVDDAIDYASDAATMGKGVGDDFRDGKVTLPVILAYARGSDADRAFWNKNLSRDPLNVSRLQPVNPELPIVKIKRGL